MTDNSTTTPTPAIASSALADQQQPKRRVNIASLFLLVVAGIGGFILGRYTSILQLPISSISTQTPSPSPASMWRKVESKRIQLSFEYPTNWPITFEPDNEFRTENGNYDPADPDDRFFLENIDFDHEWNRSAGGNRYGYLMVTRQKGIETLDDYIKYVDVPREIYSKGETVTIPRPKIVHSVVGGQEAVSVLDQSGFGRLDSSSDPLSFTVVKNGLIYQIAAIKSGPFTMSEGDNISAFKHILSTLRFEE